jgi:hypothetical protein
MQKLLKRRRVMKKIENLAKRFVRHMFKTWWNKVAAIAILACASVPMFVDKDATAFVIALIFAIPMFFAKEDWRK